MREDFLEDSSKVQNESKQKNKHYACFVFSIVFFVIAFIIFSLIITTVLDKLSASNILLFLVAYCLPLIVFTGLGFLFWLLRNKYYVEYDYSFYSGSFKVAKIIMNKKRKLLCKFSSTNIEKVGVFDSETYKNYLKMPNVKKFLYHANKKQSDDKNLYYIVVKQNKIKLLYVIECKREFIVGVINYSGRSILDRDFKWFI